MDQLLRQSDQNCQYHCAQRRTSRYRQGVGKRDWRKAVTVEVMGAKGSASLIRPESDTRKDDKSELSPTFREAVCVINKRTRHIVQTEPIGILDKNEYMHGKSGTICVPFSTACEGGARILSA